MKYLRVVPEGVTELENSSVSHGVGSTIDADVELVEKMFEAYEDSQNAIGVFWNLSKAFDCVNHETLIRKLHHYRVTGRALDLLASYLTGSEYQCR
ncbi:hypothetical protein EVAR_37484_1 [Eumeta japonica]|uniref:Reverse transcriptase domain-containing protein n=1 Tax=Eumeta variegata TaxID=151549 RepID=A0A4C1XCQ5_EUMVA|nr:hypothetical protein EVAR_37484_1 [Eumeta japonica]